MYKKITEYCKSCEICIKNKTRKSEKLGFMGNLGPASRPFEIMSLDTIGGFGGRRSTKKYLHLLVDHFTRYAYIRTSANQNSSEFIALLRKIQEIEKIETLLTDQFGGLGSKEFKQFIESEGIVHVFTAVDSAFSNGMNERANQTIVNRIRCRENEKQKKIAWSTIANKCVSEYNNTIHSVTGYSPNYLMNGVEPELTPIELKTVSNIVEDRKKAFENSLKSHLLNKERYDKKRKQVILNVGDMVYVENGNKLNREKLQEIRIGPFKVNRKISDTVYEINVGYERDDLRLYHISKMIRVQNVDNGNSDYEF